MLRNNGAGVKNVAGDCNGRRHLDLEYSRNRGRCTRCQNEAGMMQRAWCGEDACRENCFVGVERLAWLEVLLWIALLQSVVLVEP